MRLLCLDCGGVAVNMEGLKCCPHCQSQAVPADLDDSVTIQITNHELRVLTMWASNWARRMSRPGSDLNKPISTILTRLGTQTSAALTLSQEIADIRQAMPDSEVKVYNDRGEVLDL